MNKTPDLFEQRLHNHRLSSTEFEQPADVVRWMGAVQAQVFHAAKWALALRMRDATSTSIEEAYDRGEILRTHVMRPTWHFVTPEDIRWLLELTAPRVNLRCGPNYRKYEVDDAVYKKARRGLVKALQGGKHVTRAELKAALNLAGIDANDTVRMAHIMLRAELEGLVCSGAMRGKQFTYALLEERVPAAPSIDREEALTRITVRYFTSHGPATVQDFVWWCGLTTADARRGIALAGDQLTKLTVTDAVYWTGSLAKRANPVSANLLPEYDEYNVAYKNRELHPLGPSVMLNGRILGSWTAEADHNSVSIHVTSSSALKRSEKQSIAKAAESYGAYLGSPVRVAYGLK